LFLNIVFDIRDDDDVHILISYCQCLVKTLTYTDLKRLKAHIHFDFKWMTGIIFMLEILEQIK